MHEGSISTTFTQAASRPAAGDPDPWRPGVLLQDFRSANFSEGWEEEISVSGMGRHYIVLTCAIGFLLHKRKEQRGQALNAARK